MTNRPRYPASSPVPSGGFSHQNIARGKAIRAARARAEPREVRELLRSTLRRFGLDDQVTKYQFVLDWEKIVGREIAAKSRPHSLERNVLTLRVVNSEWAQELTFQKEVLLKRLAGYSAQSGDTETARVQEIRFVVGPL